MSLQLVKLLDPIQLTIAGTFTPRGAYDNATDYAVGDQVDYNGSSYIMYVDAVAGTLPTDDTKWGLIAEKGATGATGPQGDPGVVQAVVAGTNIDVDSTDPANPIVSVETLTLADISDITATAAEVNVLDGIPGTLTATELGYVDGVTSAIQTQLNAKIENLSSFDTDDLAQGTTNLYSQWESHTYGAADYLEPKTTHGLVIANDLHSSVTATFQGASAIFNGTPDGANGGVNYYGILAYGSGFTAFGALSVLGRAQGTPAAPTYVPADGYLGGYIFGGFDGTDWTVAGVNHTFPGLFGQAAADVTGGSLEADVWIGGLLTKMIGFETDTNAIKFNEAQLDSDITFYYDTGTALAIDGGTGYVGVGATPANGKLTIGTATTTAAGGLYFGTDVNLYRSAANTLKSDHNLEITGTLKSGSGSPFSVNASGSLGISIAPATSSARLAISTSATSNRGAIIKGMSGQTANLQEWQNDSGTAIAYVTSSGSIVSAGAVVASTYLQTGTTLELGHASDTTLSRSSAGVLAVEGVVVPTISSTNTLTNKRITKRVEAASDATSITPTGDSYDLTTQANTQALGTLTINAPTGTPTDGQELTLRIKSTNAHTYSFNAIYRGSLDTPLPTTHSGSSLTDYLKFIYNSADSKWDLIALSGGYA